MTSAHDGGLEVKFRIENDVPVFQFGGQEYSDPNPWVALAQVQAAWDAVAPNLNISGPCFSFALSGDWQE